MHDKINGRTFDEWRDDSKLAGNPYFQAEPWLNLIFDKGLSREYELTVQWTDSKTIVVPE
jgi:hypothetical protein